MKATVCTLITVFSVLIGLSGCARSNELSDSGIPNHTVPTETEYPVFLLEPDWPAYQTSDEVVNASTNIFAGKITDISFAIINYKTGKTVASVEPDSKKCMLYTVYTVEVTESYKGDNHGTVQIAVEGGIAGFEDEDQFALMENSGLSEEYSGIPVVENSKNLETSETYLFCTYRSAGDYDFIINMEQFAFFDDSASASQIKKQCEK